MSPDDFDVNLNDVQRIIYLCVVKEHPSEFCFKSCTRGSVNIGKPYTIWKLFSQGIRRDVQIEFPYVAWHFVIYAEHIWMHSSRLEMNHVGVHK